MVGVGRLQRIFPEIGELLIELASKRLHVDNSQGKRINMKRWELYGYPLFLIKHHILPIHVEFLLEDIMYKLWKFPKETNPCVVANVKCVISDICKEPQFRVSSWLSLLFLTIKRLLMRGNLFNFSMDKNLSSWFTFKFIIPVDFNQIIKSIEFFPMNEIGCSWWTNLSRYKLVSTKWGWSETR